MFFFFHLVAGIVLGLLLAEILDDRRWVIPCVVGAVLPDLIDKPLGYLIVPSIGYGRFFFHNFWVFILLLVAGLILWKYYLSPVILALDIGILSHHLLDSMWKDPVTWLYPALGTSPVHSPAPPDFIVYLLETDIYNPAEWVLILICIAGVVLYWRRETVVSLANLHVKTARTLLKCAEAIICILCGAAVFCFLWKIPLTDLAVKSADQYFMAITLLALAAFLLYFWELRLYGRSPAHGPKPAEDSVYIPSGPLSRELMRLDCLVRALGAEPSWVSFTSAVETAAAQGIISDPPEEPDNIFLTRITLGGIIVIWAAGCVLLLICGKVVPVGFLVPGLVATGLIVGHLIGSLEPT